jgi:hypothetical protein
MQEGSGDYQHDAEFETWHVYDAGGPMLNLKVRYREEVEVPAWEDGPDLFTALQEAAVQGWHAFDREPGSAPGEYAIVHLKRGHRPARCKGAGLSLKGGPERPTTGAT